MQSQQFTQLALPGMPRPREFMSDETRYKRGYTPQRKREVESALSSINIDPVANDDKESREYFATHTPNFITLPDSGKKINVSGLNPEAFHRNCGPNCSILPHNKRANLGKARNTLMRFLASSNVDVEHLRGINSIQLHEDYLKDNPTTNTTVAGDYDNKTKTIRLGKSIITHNPEQPKLTVEDVKEDKRVASLPANRSNELKSTLLHEVGHHADDNLKYSSLGRGEAFADNFAAMFHGKVLFTTTPVGRGGRRSYYAHKATDPVVMETEPFMPETVEELEEHNKDHEFSKDYLGFMNAHGSSAGKDLIRNEEEIHKRHRRGVSRQLELGLPGITISTTNVGKYSNTEKTGK